nr:protein TMEM155 isoform X6 [Microcebus murinus]
MTSNLIRTILMVALISKLGTAVDAERMPSGVIPQNERENLPRVCHALAFLGMTRCQDLFLVHLQGWKLGTRASVDWKMPTCIGEGHLYYSVYQFHC